MFDQPIRPEGSTVTPEDLKKKKREYMTQRRAEKRAMKLATGQAEPKEKKYTREKKSVVNRVTEYGALFNKLSEERVEAGLPPLKTAMEVLIEAMQSDELDIKEKSKIAEKLATFESSRAPIISIEHVQNVQKEEEIDAEEAMEDFLQSLRKV